MRRIVDILKHPQTDEEERLAAEYIRAECERIQATWTPRAGGHPARPTRQPADGRQAAAAGRPHRHRNGRDPRDVDRGGSTGQSGRRHHGRAGRGIVERLQLSSGWGRVSAGVSDTSKWRFVGSSGCQTAFGTTCKKARKQRYSSRNPRNTPCFRQTILSPERLPIPPLGQLLIYK